jgi:threonylcarbamoyladenosine tRNA methylthiotransferase MtaB
VTHSVYFDSIGCRLNQAEIESLAAEFQTAGYALASDAGAADVVVINTCSVTREADRDSRQKARQAHAHNPHAAIALTGCWSNLEPEAAARMPGVRWVVPNEEKRQLPARVMDVLGATPSAQESHPLPDARRRTRRFLPVQLGCDNVCAYCVTRVARGAARSVPADEVVRGIRAAEESGALEVVLTGVQLGAWGKDLGERSGLEALLNSILLHTRIPRIRLSSLEPWNLNSALLGVLSDPRMCPHLHLPLQSGCAATLRRMQRPVTPEEFQRRVEAARAAIHSLAITSDLIVGFPGETDSDFLESLEFVRAMRFARLHIFRFSARPGTVAAALPGRVPRETVRTRARSAAHADRESVDAFLRGYLGGEAEVLWEHGDGCGHFRGGTRNGISVRIQANEELHNRLSRVRLEKILDGEMLGVLL